VPTFDIIKHDRVPESYRVARVLSDFDMDIDKGSFEAHGEIALPDEWNVGLIYGGSGTGKTSIVRELFPDAIVDEFDWGTGAFIDAFDKSIPFEDISKALYSVGLGSVPTWVRPYSVLSNGEKMRACLARGALERDFFVFDEFTSVVDRQVAKVCSLAISRFVKKKNKKFLAISCHSDIVDWLEPDWAFCTDSMTQTFHLARTPRQNISSGGAGSTNGANLKSITI
jgi:ABC-type polar amino acid transport system ATPase subunit